MTAFFKVLEVGAIWTPTIIRDHGRHLTVRMLRTKEGEVPFVVGDIAARSSSSSWTYIDYEPHGFAQLNYGGVFFREFYSTFYFWARSVSGC